MYHKKKIVGLSKNNRIKVEEIAIKKGKGGTFYVKANNYYNLNKTNLNNLKNDKSVSKNRKFASLERKYKELKGGK